jgi:hypothetical protein
MFDGCCCFFCVFYLRTSESSESLCMDQWMGETKIAGG